MAIAYDNRCEATSWRGKGDAPGRNRCVMHVQSRTPHPVHRDECGNDFIVDSNGCRSRR